MRRPRARVAPTVLLAAVLAACSSPSRGAPSPATPTLVIVPYPTTGPVVVVAIDNHFHDIHPDDHRQIAEDRPFVVKNEGRNLHNFTVVGTEISIDIRPGRELRWSQIGDELDPGSYRIICRYHGDVGMIGAFSVTAAP